MAYLAEGAMDYLHGASLSLVVLLFMPTLMNVMFQEGKSKYCLISIGCQLVINIVGDLYNALFLSYDHYNPNPPRSDG